MCCVVVCIKLTCLERLPSLLLLYGFDVSLLGCFVLLLYLYLCWCCFYTCLHLFSDLCCSNSCWHLSASLGSAVPLLVPVYEFVLFVLLSAPVP